MPLLNKVARIDAIDIDSAHVRELNSIREKIFTFKKATLLTILYAAA